MKQKKTRSRVLRNGFILLCVICLLFCAAAGCDRSDKKEDTSKLPVVVVGVDNYPPYSYEDADGQSAGVDVELATEAFGRMGYRVEFKYIDWEAKKQLVESGEIDCIWSSFSINGREDLYNWSSPYMYSRQVVVVRKDSDIQSLSDLLGKRIAVQSTTKPEEILLAHNDPRIPEFDELISLQNRELIYAYLSKGYVDAIATHETAILQCMADYELEYRILQEPLLQVGLGVAFAKSDDRGIDEKLSETFAAMRADGTTEKIIGNYLSDPQRYLEVGSYEK